MQVRLTIVLALATAVFVDMTSTYADEFGSLNKAEQATKFYAKVSTAGVSSDWQRDASDERKFRRVRVTADASSRHRIPIEFFADRGNLFPFPSPLEGTLAEFTFEGSYPYLIGNRTVSLTFDEIVFDRCYSLDIFEDFGRLEDIVTNLRRRKQDTRSTEQLVANMKKELRNAGWYVRRISDAEVQRFLSARNKRLRKQGDASDSADRDRSADGHR